MRQQFAPIDQFDPQFLEKIRPIFWPLEKYFRYEARGLENLPKKGPALVVMNHGIIPYHGFLFSKKLVDDLKIYPRGLGADFLFDIPYIRDFFLKGGALPANPQNGEYFLKKKNILLLSPGGIYEALIAKGGLRRIPWERRKGFVELAIKMKAPIIPSYCQGINSVYFNSYFLLKWRIKFFEKSRFGLPLFLGLGLLPFPRKLTQLVGRPISTGRLKGESAKEQIERIHQAVLDSMAELAQRKVN